MRNHLFSGDTVRFGGKAVTVPYKGEVSLSPAEEALLATANCEYSVCARPTVGIFGYVLAAVFGYLLGNA